MSRRGCSLALSTLTLAMDDWWACLFWLVGRESLNGSWSWSFGGRPSKESRDVMVEEDQRAGSERPDQRDHGGRGRREEHEQTAT